MEMKIKEKVQNLIGFLNEKIEKPNGKLHLVWLGGAKYRVVRLLGFGDRTLIEGSLSYILGFLNGYFYIYISYKNEE